ncbi:beta-N-acetylhexosaminidase [Methyloparacoccus murrellii]
MSQHPMPGPVMLDVEGLSLSDEERQRLRHPATGGLILFRRNFESPAQLMELVTAIRDANPALLIAVDHEGGRVQRFRDGFTRLPPAARYALANDPELAEQAGWLMAAELRALDIDFSFAPVLDVECGISQVIGDRAFGQEPETVVRLATAFARGMRRAGMAAVGKHFPGHGSVAEDSHLALPVDRRPLAAIEARDLRPFAALIAAGLEGVMPAHVIYERIDAHPAGFSCYWIQDVLRTRLGFAGAVFSDDLSMAGAAYAGDAVDRARLALAAGCDMVLVCNAPGAAAEVLEALAGLPGDSARATRLARMRGRFPLDRAALLASPEWHAVSARVAALNET